MAETAAYLRDDLLPVAPYRQWVLTLPWELRARLSVDRQLLSEILAAFLRPIFSWQRRRGRLQGVKDGETGSVTFLQRFGGALNLHPHFHTLIPDGLFFPIPGCEELEFVSLPPPSAEDVASLTERIARRITKRVRKLLESEEATGSRLEETVLSMESSLLRSMRVPVGGRVVYELPRPWPHSAGVTHLTLDGREFLQRLSSLIPSPYMHLTRYHGVFSSRSKWRSRLPSPPVDSSRSVVEDEGESKDEACGSASGTMSVASEGEPPTQESESTRRRGWTPWSVLLARVFYVDALRCRHCGGRRKVLSLLTDPLVVKKILIHLGLSPTPLPLTASGERERLAEWEPAPVEEWEEFPARPEYREEGPSSGRDPPMS